MTSYLSEFFTRSIAGKVFFLKELLNFQTVVFIFSFITPCAGYTGGSHYSHKGAAVEPLCLPRNPEWGMYTGGYDGLKNYVYGAEYKTKTFTGYIQTIHDHDVPCAVCLVRQRTVVQMFPGKFGNETKNVCSR